MTDRKKSSLERLNYIVASTGEVYREAALKLGINHSVMDVMYAITINGGSCLLGDITSSMGISKQTMNSALRKMESEGLVYLENYNGRSKLVKYTEKGLELSQKTVERIIRAENSIFAQWSREDTEMYIALSQRFLNDIKGKIKEL